MQKRLESKATVGETNRTFMSQSLRNTEEFSSSKKDNITH